MRSAYNVVTLGASYGALLALKLAGAGHTVTLVCRAETAQLINEEGVRITFPSDTLSVTVDSRRLPGRLTAAPPSQVDPAQFDLVVLAMQEPQYCAPEVRDLLARIARAERPCMSIMNMPPAPYLARLGIAGAHTRSAFTDVAIWDRFDPDLMTLCSPDAQATRPSKHAPNVLQVRLATNFKTAPFAHEAHTNMLLQLERDIELARFPLESGIHGELPVKLKVHRSVYVPFAKWSMLLTGNYRCVHEGGTRSIAEAVHGDPQASRATYEWVLQVCRLIGAKDEDLVPFDRYAKAALVLRAPSSAARALASGASEIERVDRLVQAIAANADMQCDEVDRTVELIDAVLETNRRRQREVRSAGSSVVN